MIGISIALGLAVLFNFVILRSKWNDGKYADAAVDLGMLIILNIIFGSSILGVISATVGSTFISLYLMRYPVTLPDYSETFSQEDSEPSELDLALSRMQDRIDALASTQRNLHGL